MGALDCFGAEFDNASPAQKVKMIDAAIGRVLVSQESEIGSNKNSRALLRDLQQTRSYYMELAWYAQNPSRFDIGWFERR